MINLKSKEEIEIMREAGKIVAETHELLKSAIIPGVSTLELDTIAEENIRKYAELMNELGLSALEITEDGSKIRLEREAAPASAVTVPVMQPLTLPSASNGADTSSALDADIITITSPMVGVFYAAPTENAEHFVSVGARVKKGDTLCIIEAMKLMNEIQSDYDCEIEAVLVSNEQKVEYGQPLFRVKRL